MSVTGEKQDYFENDLWCTLFCQISNQMGPSNQSQEMLLGYEEEADPATQSPAAANGFNISWFFVTV